MKYFKIQNMKRVQRSGAANRKLKIKREEKIENDIKKTKCMSNFLKSDLLLLKVPHL
jgi:hypothetical protein